MFCNEGFLKISINHFLTILWDVNRTWRRRERVERGTSGARGEIGWRGEVGRRGKRASFCGDVIWYNVQWCAKFAVLCCTWCDE